MILVSLIFVGLTNMIFIICIFNIYILNIPNETQYTDSYTDLDNYPVSEDTPYTKDRLTEAQENPIFNDFIPSVNIFNKFVEINKKTFDILPKDFKINTENIICPLYSLCLYNSPETTDIFNHILQFHDKILPFNFNKSILISENFSNTISLLTYKNIINYFENFYLNFEKTFSPINFNHLLFNNQNQILTIFKNKIKC
ncbi:hypothetical protein TRFO_36858 [Tritrichomonas foetus]|uniref:Uncharacterized protein n=1 Tax=Tritrichomonas foetus TaxID=1144522 RepID=A0A1J4JCU3_9EUKA|nr:hypothetical protein TRFO_36858 [Tritrichomonas foetus]|eukprot:OHS96998.1 hypothetical protein TRFO_36858 [Tritrichomonas foetus]